MVKRSLEKHVKRLARQYPVVTITGPRQSGKSTLCKLAFPKYRLENLEIPDVRQRAMRDPHSFLSSVNDGLVLDEIQRVPELTSYIQGLVDENSRPGRFILTGSQQFEVIDSVSQSLAGRSALVRVLPFSMAELYVDRSVPTLDSILLKGFFPRIHDKKLNSTEAMAFYVATYLERDIRRLINVKDLSTFEGFLGLCAGRIGQIVNMASLANDCGIDQKTVKSWISVLEASYVIYLLKPHFRSFNKRLIKSSKLYFCDVALAAYLLGIQDKRQIEKHPLRGFLFENLVILEFLKKRFNNVRDSNLFFFRDHMGNEVDLILDYGTHVKAIEIKASQTITNDFFKGLEFYSKLGSNFVRDKYLIYSGKKDYISRDVHVHSYSNLP